MVSEAQSLGDNETLEKVFIQGMRFITLIDGSVLVFIAVFSQQILGLWINPDFASQSWFLLILTAMGYIFYALSITPYHILLGMGRPKMLAVFNLVTTLSVILGLYIGVTWFGLVGGCVGAMLGFLTAAIMPIYVQNVLRISWTKAFNQSYGRTVLITTGAAFLSMLLPHFIEIRIVFFAVFIVTLILLGNIQPEDWKLLQRQWKQTTTQIVILRDQIAHRN